jgi:2-keto-4-pentenoate hydratase
MTEPIKISEAANFIIDHWRNETRCAQIPSGFAPKSRDAAYHIQAEMEKQSAHPLYGWKIAATSTAGQKHIGVSGPLAGRYIAERVVTSGGAIPFGRNHMKVAEVEFAFRLANDLPPRVTPYSEDEVFESVASLHPAIEIPDSRYDRFETVGAFQLIADNACAHWLTVGDAMPDDWRSMDLAEFKPTGRVKDKSEITGSGSSVLGSPRNAMTWLVNELSAHGVSAKAGQIVTTGTCVVPMVIAAGDHVEGDFGALGRVEVRLGAA